MIREFFLKYFIEPRGADLPYNIYNTLAYGVVLILFLVLISKLLERMKVKVDRNFYLALLPFILIGPTVRVLFDAGMYRGYYVGGGEIFFSLTISPGVYFLIFLPALAFLAASWLVERRFGFPYYKSLFVSGVATFIALHAYFYSEAMPVAFDFRASAVFLVASFTVVSCALFYGAVRRLKLDFFKGIPLFLVFTHLYDASTTFVGMQFFGYFEKHVVPTLFINAFGPVAMYALKLAVIPLVVYYLRDLENRTERNFIYFAIFVLGFAPGTRNMLLEILGV